MNVAVCGHAVVSVDKLDKMIARLQRIVQYLDNSCSIELHRRVDQSFFMQKLEELYLLKLQLEDATARLHRVQARVNAHYIPVYETWRKAVRSLP